MTFVEQVKLLRALQMGPLSAASMEMGSYFRGYDYIIRLVLFPIHYRVVNLIRATLYGINSRNTSQKKRNNNRN